MSPPLKIPAGSSKHGNGVEKESPPILIARNPMQDALMEDMEVAGVKKVEQIDQVPQSEE